MAREAAHKLSRQVRFSVNPFLPADNAGFNSYASKPCGEGLAIYFGLWVHLEGQVERATGFVVNVSDIDAEVRRSVVPVFGKRIQELYADRKHISIEELAGLLGSACGVLKDKFSQVKLSCLELELNPFRKIRVESEDCKVVYFSEKFEFAAMHKLWNDEFSEEENFSRFGKCANPAGHGHNYIIEVTVKNQAEGEFSIGEFQRIVDVEFIKSVDHKNLNEDVAEFGRMNPTVENIAVFAWDKLAGKFGKDALHCVTVWENDRTCCSYYG